MVTVAALRVVVSLGLVVGGLAVMQVGVGNGEDISCKYLLGGMTTALVGTNSFWALWIRAVFKEKDAILDARIKDLREAALKIKTD